MLKGFFVREDRNIFGERKNEMRQELQYYSEIPFTRHMLNEALVEYERRNDKISYLLQKEELIALRRGLYIPGPGLDLPMPDRFLIANYLRGPSYISLESALSYWGMIPERVYTVSSATLKTSKEYNTQVGRFEYRYLPSPYYSFGIRSVRLTKAQTVLMASPEKALCDKIVLTSGVILRSVSQAESFLFDDMRMDEEEIFNLNLSTITSWIEDAPKKTSLEVLVKTLSRYA